jgi:hypothetical protein
VRSAEVMSTVPTVGTLMLVDGTLIGTFEGIPMPSPATSLVALACCCAGSPAGPTSVVAEQFHPAAAAGSGTTTTPAMVRAMRDSEQSGRTSISQGSDRRSEGGP